MGGDKGGREVLTDPGNSPVQPFSFWLAKRLAFTYMKSVYSTRCFSRRRLERCLIKTLFRQWVVDSNSVWQCSKTVFSRPVACVRVNCSHKNATLGHILFLMFSLHCTWFSDKNGLLRSKTAKNSAARSQYELSLACGTSILIC